MNASSSRAENDIRHTPMAPSGTSGSAGLTRFTADLARAALATGSVAAKIERFSRLLFPSALFARTQDRHEEVQAGATGEPDPALATTSDSRNKAAPPIAGSNADLHAPAATLEAVHETAVGQSVIHEVHLPKAPPEGMATDAVTSVGLSGQSDLGHWATRRENMPLAGTHSASVDMEDNGEWAQDIASTVRRLCLRATPTMQNWTITLPLNAQTLPEATLRIEVWPHSMSLRFCTSSPVSAHRVARHQRALESLLGSTLNKRFDVDVDVA